MAIRLMRVPEVEAEYGIPAATLRWYRHMGKGPRSSRLGTRIVYRREDVEAWIIAWHRLGVDGSFPALPSPLTGRTQRGGVLWSGSRGKVCPGDRRIEQIPGILARAMELVAGPDPTPAPAPASVPDVQEDDNVILIRNTADGRVYLVSGGRATYLADSADQGALLRARVKQVDVTTALASTIAKWT